MNKQTLIVLKGFHKPWTAFSNVPKLSHLFCGIILLSTIGVSVAELNLPIGLINHWATEFGETIFETSAKATGLFDLQTDYLLQKPKVHRIQGAELVWSFKTKMEKMLEKKVEAIRRLVESAEKAHEQHEHDKDLSISYPNAKKLETEKYKRENGVFQLTENEHFNYIKVNLTNSTVHVPTNVFDESEEVLNGVHWSEKLDEDFQANYEKDPTLTWQYFGSASGFFRNYPGLQWRTDTWNENMEREKRVDIYDCRMRGWYIQAATSPKDIVILLDASGSMTGQRMEIAKATVEKILDTLSDDDFFNIIWFSEAPLYVDDCFNRTLVQANADNKKRLKAGIKNVITKDIADFDKALKEAFDLIKQMNTSHRGTMCNRAIMIITDGAPETFEDIFQKYNWPEKHTRVFTYLIGREVSDSKQVKWMACANKGYHSHISTLADVQEKVQEYIHVISRPMVIKRVYHTTWTSVYIDVAGLKLMTSVAQPVFDRRNATKRDGILLGVMGTDVPLKELTKLTPQYKLGVNGYAFAITNNGYILFHPDFRPTKGELVKPNYNSVDLAEVELAVSAAQMQDEEIPVPNYDFKLRKEMVDRRTNSLVMEVKIHYDDMKRVTTRQNNYFYTAIDDTPFSLGIALPSGYGMHFLDGRKKLDQHTDLNAFTASMTKIANWNYCKMETNESRQDPVEMLLKYLESGKNGEDLEDKCDMELIESLLFDAEATRGALAAWMKDNNDDIRQNQDSVSRKSGIELVFLGTKAGLTRYYNIVQNLTDPTFLDENVNTIEEMYYKRAVEGGESIFTFSVPFNAGEVSEWNTTVVTASSPIIISEEGREAVAAVVGLQMRYDKFYESFMSSTELCPNRHGPCNLTCKSDELDCFLLDNNGFVVLSKNQREIGKFFGEIDPTLMKELIKDADGKEGKEGVLTRIPMYDYQGICEIWVKGGSGASSLFLDPLRKIFGSALWILHEIIIFLAEFSIRSWWYGEYSTASAEEKDINSIESAETLVEVIMERLGKFGSNEQLYEWRNQLVGGSVDYSNKEDIIQWYDAIRQQYSPRLVGYESCTKAVPLYVADFQSLSQFDTMDLGCWCRKSYSIHKVHRTNLMLLAADAQCYCAKDSPFSVNPQKVDYTDEQMCQRLQTEIYRSRPKECHYFHPEEDARKCGDASFIHPSLALMLLMLTVTTSVTMTTVH